VHATFVHASATGMITAALLLLARRQRLFLLRRNEAFHFLASLLMQLSGLLLFLLRCERGVRAYSLDLRPRVSLDGPALLHYGFLNTGLLPAGSEISAARGAILSLRISWRRSSLREQRRCAEKKGERAEKFFQHW
jgi:hypothetical protein